MFRYLAIMIMFVLAIAGQVLAEPTSGPVFTGAEQEEARQALQALGTAMGVEETPAPTAEPDKTVADVADKALDMVAGMVTTISSKMEQVAPRVWEVMIRQQYAKAVGDTVVPLGLMLVLISLTYVARRPLRDVKKEDRIFFEDTSLTEFGFVWFLSTLLPGFVMFLLSIWLFNRVSDSVMYLVNPEYYAVQDLLRMLLSPSSPVR